jgi:hypothetical protein
VSATVKPAEENGSLPFTGWAPLPVAALGLLALAVGLALMRVLRTRTGSRSREVRA